jgi:hypothetical protein
MMADGTSMDITLFFVASVAMLCLVVAAVVIMHPRIHEGLMIKTGLITLAIGSFSVLAHVPGLRPDITAELLPLLRSLTLCSAGILIVGGGLAWRVWHYPGAREIVRAASGWTPLDEQPEPD